MWSGHCGRNPDLKKKLKDIYKFSEVEQVEALTRCCRVWADEDTLDQESVKLAEFVIKVLIWLVACQCGVISSLNLDALFHFCAKSQAPGSIQHLHNHCIQHVHKFCIQHPQVPLGMIPGAILDLKQDHASNSEVFG
jgi:hypothetical protein